VSQTTSAGITPVGAARLQRYQADNKGRFSMKQTIEAFLAASRQYLLPAKPTDRPQAA
jgi:hypothetical protein